MIRKKKIAYLIITAVLMFSFSALPAARAAEITVPAEKMIQRTMKRSRITAVSAAAVSGGHTQFFSEGIDVDENSLFYIGSLSKAFTGYAILYLESLGLLSLSDPVTAHIPWFETGLRGQNRAELITVAHLLHHSSGYTNSEKDYPAATPDMDLEDYVKALSGKNLKFSPGEHFAYANANYNLLGFIIEQVSGKGFAGFMEQQIFAPLGLTQTFAAPDAAAVVKGARLFFGRAQDYELPASKGNVPAGYIISCAKDLSRWLQIHLGAVALTGNHASALGEAHLVNPDFPTDGEEGYAAGWFVGESGEVHHSGGTPNYSSRLVFQPKDGLGACVLANMNASFSTDDMADNLLVLLSGGTQMQYRFDIWRIVDVIFSVLTVVFLLLTAEVAVIAIIKRERQKKQAKAWYTLPAAVASLAVLCALIMPAAFAAPWKTLVTWAPLSLPLGMLAAVLFSAVSALALWCSRSYSRKKT